MTGDLPFPDQGRRRHVLCDGAVLLHGHALAVADVLLAALPSVTDAAPFRHMVTRGGYRMSVAMTNCGELGWISDRTGYRYSDSDPASGLAWPAMPQLFRDLAVAAAVAAGFADFDPDVCLINRYEPGTRLALHQDRDEHDFASPIVSVSLGAPAVFLFGGRERGGKVQRIPLLHGDVVVWGGPARLNFHGIAPLKPGAHATALGANRINLTFRKAG